MGASASATAADGNGSSTATAGDDGGTVASSDSADRMYDVVSSDERMIFGGSMRLKIIN